MLARPAMLARLAAPIAPIANVALHASPARFLAEILLGVSRSAPLPAFSQSTFRSGETALQMDLPPAGPRPTIAYFHGCSVNHYEPSLGDLLLRIFDVLGYDVCLPPQGCCGLPLQSNGLFDAARAYARVNLRGLAPFASAGTPILGTSTSCTFALKHEYRAILGLEDEAATTVAGAVYDVFEFLRDVLPPPNALDNLRPVPMRILYHPPCQLKTHGIGFPAYDVLRRIPGLDIELSDHECCGVAGTYGLKRERYAVAHDVGSGLFAQIRQAVPDFIVTDSETCRWWLAGHTHVPALHPLEILAKSLGIEAPSANAVNPEPKA
jgi:glycerol-3-phosphate dehydrogenase subunit C